MGGTPPKKRRSKRKQGMHRSHHLSDLARRVNARSPVKVITRKSRLKKLRAQKEPTAKSSK